MRFWNVLLPTRYALSKKNIQCLYEDILNASRNIHFYQDLRVPDTLDGRFEVLCMMVSIASSRLIDIKMGKSAQHLFDAMFRNVEAALREIPIGDLSIPRHMKRMMAAYNGRSLAYRKGLQNRDSNDLQTAIRNNMYGTVCVIDGGDQGVPEDILQIVEGLMQKLYADFPGIISDDKSVSLIVDQFLQTEIRNASGA